MVPDRRAPRSSAAGLAGVRPRPRNRARSVSYSTGPSAAETWTAQIGFWSAARGRRRASRASGPGTNSVSRNSLREGRVGLVGAAVVQAHLGVAGQVELAGPVPVVDERDQADFRVVVRRDADGQAGLDLAVAAAELGPVGGERELVFVGGPAERLVAGRPGRAIAEVADVTELPPAVAGRVLAPAGHVQVPPGADPSPGGGDQNAVAAVGQQGDGGTRRLIRGGLHRSRGRCSPRGSDPVPSVEVAIE